MPQRVLVLSLVLAFGVGAGAPFALAHTSDEEEYDDSTATVEGDEEQIDFDAALDGYGEWEYLPGYGRVFIPYVSASWQPYLYGCWTWSDWGWYWVSYEPWGYWPHHYGAWDWIYGYGWCWMPGYHWSACNVHWYCDDDYVGWCSRGVRAADRTADRMTVVSARDFGSERLYAHALRADQVPAALRARPAPTAAPTKAALEQASGRTVRSLDIATRQVQRGAATVTVREPQGAGHELVTRMTREVRPTVARTSAAPQLRQRASLGHAARAVGATSLARPAPHARPRPYALAPGSYRGAPRPSYRPAPRAGYGSPYRPATPGHAAPSPGRAAPHVSGSPGPRAPSAMHAPAPHFQAPRLGAR